MTLLFGSNPGGEHETSFSAEGEDILVQRVLKRMFAGKDGDKGTYVDVGAHDPWLHNNTAALWLRGWRGVNIDPLPGVKERFDAVRPGDQNFKLGASCGAGEQKLMIYDRPQLSRIEEDTGAFALRDHRGSKCVAMRLVQCDTLDNILLGTPSVDFLTVDVEGHEWEVLQGFQALRSSTSPRRPKVICVEILTSSMRKFLEHPVVEYLERCRYTCLSRLHCSAIFVDETRARFL